MKKLLHDIHDKIACILENNIEIFIHVKINIHVCLLLLGNTHIIHDSFNTCVNAVHILGFTTCTDNIYKNYIYILRMLSYGTVSIIV